MLAVRGSDVVLRLLKGLIGFEYEVRRIGEVKKGISAYFSVSVGIMFKREGVLKA